MEVSFPGKIDENDPAIVAVYLKLRCGKGYPVKRRKPLVF
jgi:hypothetical protein